MARPHAPARQPQAKPRVHSARRAASLRNLQKAWEASRAHWELTPARRASSLRTIKLAQEAIRGKRRKLSPLQLAAVRRNMARARVALNARGRSPEHLAKLRQTIQRARAARTPQGRLLQAEKVLKHGLFARRLRGPLARLGESRREQRILERRVVRYLDPQNAREEKSARQIAAALSRHQRLYFAQAAWERESLRDFLTAAPRPKEVSAEFARLRAYALLEILLERERSAAHSWRLLSKVEGLLRRFIALRAAGDSRFRMGPRIIAGRGQDRMDPKLEDLITDPDLRIELLENDLASL